MIPDWTNSAYLLSGVPHQRAVYHMLQSLRAFDILRPYSPTLAGTIPLNIDVEGSDLDIICEAHDLDAFEQDVAAAFAHYADFKLKRTEKNGLSTLIASFIYSGWAIEIFAQPRPVKEQNAYRHMLAEAHLLQAGGDQARLAIRQLKGSGLKTEPAFARYFAMAGDPYQALLDYERRIRESEGLSARLAHIFWLGGSPCSGKSSIARILSEEYGLRTYSCDEMYEAHLKRAIPGKHPRMSKAAQITWDEVWMHPVEYLVEREIAFYREEFELIIEDLSVMPADTPLCAEGAGLLPECVAVLGINPHHAIWVVPTEELQRREYGRREWVQGILAQCSQPEQAWENWMGRDVEFARRVALQAERVRFGVMEVDGSRSVESNARQLARHFGLYGSQGP